MPASRESTLAEARTTGESTRVGRLESQAARGEAGWRRSEIRWRRRAAVSEAASGRVAGRFAASTADRIGAM